MIVVGVDVHKQSLTAVAVDEAGRALAEVTVDSAARAARLVGVARAGAVVGARGLPAADPHARADAARVRASGWCGCRRS